MPLFGSKFSPKKAPLRKRDTNTPRELIEELVSNQRRVHLKLGDQQYLFESGDWVPESGKNSATHKTNKKLKKTLDVLKEENNLLQLKFEIMLNMLTQTTIDSQNYQTGMKK